MKKGFWTLLCCFVLIAATFVTSCVDEKINAPDVSGIDVEVSLTRSEREVAKIDTTNALASLDALFQSDSSFYDIYFNSVLRVRLNRMTDEQKEKFIIGFVNDTRIRRINQEVDSVFTDFGDMKTEFEQAFRYMKYYFPEKDVPELYTYISEYSVQRFIFEKEEGKDGLGIGLDMFLGEEYPYADYVGSNASFSNYLTRRYNKEHLVKRVMGVLVGDWLGDVNGERLLDKMIYNGKRLYVIQQLVPYTTEDILMEYTIEQLAWCEENQGEMWSFFFNEDLFYSTDINKISKLVNPSPNSAGMPPEAPGRTANYMGLQIVKAFMKRNPEMSIQDLIDMRDSQKILEKSKYKPKRK